MSLTFPQFDPLATYEPGAVVSYAIPPGPTMLYALNMPPGSTITGVPPGDDPVWVAVIVTTANAPASREWVRARWADANDIPDPVLDELLAASWSRCVEFIPAELVDAYDAGTLPGGVLLRWREANMLDARELWKAAQRDGDAVAFDSYALRVRALSDAVRSLLRPRRGAPMVG